VLRFWCRFPPFVSIVILLLVGCVECRAQSAIAEASSPPILPSHTPVILRLKKSLSKRDAKPGQPVEFEVGYDVVVNGQIVIQSGTAVEGSVRQVDHMGKGPAKVLIDLGPAQTISGEPLLLVLPSLSTNQSGGMADVVGWGAEAGPLLPVLVIMSLFEKKVVLNQGDYGVVDVAEDVALDPTKQKAAQEQYKADRKAAEAELCELLASPDPKNPERVNALARRIGLDNSRKAELLHRAGDLDAAIEVYQQLLTSKLELPCSVVPLPLFFGSLELAEHVPAEAREQLLKLITINSHLELAGLYREKRDFVRATAEYRTAVQLDPENPDSRIRLVNALQDSGDLDGAIAEVKEASRIWADNPYFHYLLGRALVKKNDADAAIVELQGALQKTKNHFSLANCELGHAYELKGDLKAAVGQYRTAYRAHVDDEQCRAAYQRLELQLKR
jgi:tetratricopeptide (TPR) repeat protein